VAGPIALRSEIVENRGSFGAAVAPNESTLASAKDYKEDYDDRPVTISRKRVVVELS